MGLIKSVNDITYELQDQKSEKEMKRREKKRLEFIKNELYNYFDKQFKKDKNAKYTYTEMLKHKELIIDQLKQHYFEKYNIKLNNSNINHIKQNYYKILNSVKRQYFEMDKIREKEEAEQDEKETKSETINAGAWIGGIVTTILIIIFLPLLFCLFIIGSALKSI